MTSTTPSDSEKLDPCPFCGGPADAIARVDLGYEPDVHCRKSDCGGYAETVTAWNTRAPDSDRQQGGVEAWPPIPDQRTRGHPLVEIVREAHDEFLRGAARPTDDSATFIARRVRAALAALTTQPVPKGEGFTSLDGMWKDQHCSRLERVKAHRSEFGSSLKAAVEAVDEEVARQQIAQRAQPAPAPDSGRDELVAGVWRLILAADSYGVQHLDSDDMDEEATELQAATEAMKDLIGPLPLPPANRKEPG